MTPEYIIEICVAIDIAILGIAYPIIVDKISNIGDKYNSQYIPVLFDSEFPQKSLSITINKNNYRISFFKFIMYFTISSLIFMIFKIPPLFGWDNWFVNDSAKFLVLALSLLFTVSFFIWLDKVVLFNGKSTSLLTHIIKKYELLKGSPEASQYHLKAINELTFYAIEKQDEHLQETLLDFYYKVFAKIRKNHDKNKPLVYPIDLYFLVNKLNVEIVNTDNKKLKAIEHRAVSGVWLLGEDFEEINISDDTYNWLWRNIYIFCDNPRFVKMFWSNSNQYFTYNLKMIHADYEKGSIANEAAIAVRQQERNSFLELHYALGGLMLYRNRYDVLKYIFEYSQSQPPQYVLLPQSMTEIFNWFEHFRNDFKNTKLPIDIKYSFPELDNLGSRSQVNHWICKYLVVLFMRQYTLRQYYTFQNFTALPVLPNEVVELNNWLDTVSYFENILRKIISNDVLLNELELYNIAQEKSIEFLLFVDRLKSAINKNIADKKISTELSDEKIASFYINSANIIRKSFSKYNSVFTSKDINQEKNKVKIPISGGIVLMSKSSFVEDDIPSLNFDTFFAGQIASQNIERLIPKSFSVSKTKRYLLNKDNFLLGIDRIINGAKDIVIVGVEVRHEVKQILDNSHFRDMTRYIPSTEYDVQDALFIVAESDLPVIEHKNIDESTITELNLVLIDKDLQVYSSVLDINKNENSHIKNRWNLEDAPDTNDLKVQLAIVFSSVIYWGDEREVVQVNIASEYREQGIENNVNDIESMKSVNKDIAN
ncbi:hypothetical protein [Hymenobacter yonginensis]|uniref:Uncharacterized protein n=1 Tax=Hymenobacter yonginensis TaxID=748197 RepID=A0ABY7PVD6_9BACT|nr:hypothetical protein [Hymenobacter yonginensis]WBO86863.1 hypothetical protein O9Z63_20485 [Hymenobacter yonginensis]